MNFQNNSNTEFAFYSRYNEEKLELKFDCVVGKNVVHKFPLHIHESLCIGLVTKGERDIILSGKAEKIKQNEVFIINRTQPHTINQIEPHDYIVITISGNLENTFFGNIIKSDECADLFLQLFDALKSRSTIILAERWGHLYKYLTDKHTLSSTLITEEGFIEKSLRYIQDNYRDRISVDDIATHACMSTYHFCRLFKHFAGLPPHNYLKQYRLSRSYKCLQQNMSIFDTAIKTGFHDSSHLIRTFHSYMAVSPKQYQKSVTKQ